MPHPTQHTAPDAAQSGASAAPAIARGVRGGPLRRLLSEAGTVLSTVRLRGNIARIICWFIPQASLTTFRAAIYRYVAGMRIGKRVAFSSAVRITGTGRGLYQRLSIGEGTILGEYTVFNLDDTISIGRNVAIGPYVYMYTSGHEMGWAEHRMDDHLRNKPVVIEDGAWIGMSVIILPGVTIGHGAVVGPGSVVRSDVPPNTLVSGVPATIVKQLD
jgi:maltose O-acetyltransferase